MKSVVVIGGGIIGLCSAYFLQKEGNEVTVLDQSTMDFGASYVNAGYITPSHFIPLAAPGMMMKGIKWMFNPASPLYIKPRLDFDFLKWAYAFNKSCNKNHVLRSAGPLKIINEKSRALFELIKEEEKFSFQYEKKGLLMLCQTEKALEDEISVADIARKEGLEASDLSAKEVLELEPNTKMDIKGAVHYHCDAHTTPHEFMQEMKTYLLNSGVKILTNQHVNDIQVTNGVVASVSTGITTYKADEFVIAAGSWSNILSKKLGTPLLLQAGKGYRMNTSRATGITIPSILAEAKVAITPMNGFTRFAGTMEVAGINRKVNKIRVNAIADAVNKYYPEIKINTQEREEVKTGLRPVSPDGMPYIGRSSKSKNVIFATGHAMMGWSLGPITGKLVSELVSNKKTSLDLSYYHPDRKF